MERLGCGHEIITYCGRTSEIRKRRESFGTFPMFAQDIAFIKAEKVGSKRKMLNFNRINWQKCLQFQLL